MYVPTIIVEYLTCLLRLLQHDSLKCYTNYRKWSRSDTCPYNSNQIFQLFLCFYLLPLPPTNMSDNVYRWRPASCACSVMSSYHIYHISIPAELCKHPLTAHAHVHNYTFYTSAAKETGPFFHLSLILLTIWLPVGFTPFLTDHFKLISTALL